MIFDIGSKHIANGDLTRNHIRGSLLIMISLFTHIIDDNYVYQFEIGNFYVTCYCRIPDPKIWHAVKKTKRIFRKDCG